MSSSPRPERPAHRVATRLRRLAPRSLTGRLVVTTLLLVALVSVLVALGTTLALRHFLVARLDEQLAAASRREAQHPSFPLDPGQHDFPCAVAPDGDQEGPIGFGQGAGTLIARFDPTCRSAVIVTAGGTLLPLDRGDIAKLAGLPVSQEPRSVTVDSGSYRLEVTPDGDGRSITGLPLADVSATVRKLVVLEGGVALGGVLVAAAVGQYLVRRQLDPLRRVAATATAVTRLSLESGEVAAIGRVPAELTDTSTEVGQVGAALNAMLGHVEQALDTRHESEQRVRQFVADASHELRTPLSTIQGYAELSRRTTNGAPSSPATMQRIEAASQRMSSLVDDMLLLARLDSGRPLQRQEVDLSLLLAEAVNDARVVSPDHQWRLALPVEPVQAVGDVERLHQVISNVLSNAIRHTPAGTTVSVAASPVTDAEDAPSVRMSVSDDGPGMPPELVGKAFERFARGDTARTRDSGGSGLGLSIVQAIVRAHGGHVSVESHPGATTVTIELPAARAPRAGRSADAGASAVSDAH